MKLARGIAVLVAVALVLGLTGPAGADPKNQREMLDLVQVELIGIIVAIDPRDRSFVLRQERRGEDLLWLVRLLPRTRIDFGRRDDDDDRDRDWDRERFIGPDGFWPLRVGQVVAVGGRIIEGRRILAQEVKILGRSFRNPPFGDFRSPVRIPLRPPEILIPHDGAEVAARQLVVVGRTVPRARVHIEVLTAVAFFQFLVGSADVNAGEDGIFVATIRPSGVVGGTYRITVQATAGGVTLPRATVHVRLR